MPEIIHLEKAGGVGQVIMDSPPANALSPALLAQMDQVLAAIEGDDDIRAVLFRSALPKIFMAGADLKYLLGLDEEGFRRYARTAQDLVNRVESLPKPTLAVLNGHTLGGGCEFCLACDFRYMTASKAAIGLPEVALGLLPGAGGTQRLTRLIGRGRATELLLTGRTLDGPGALAVGLVDRIFEDSEHLLAESLQMVETLAQGATRAIARIKACLRKAGEDSLSVGLDAELEGIVHLFTRTRDAKEGVTAFSEKRVPHFTGR